MKILKGQRRLNKVRLNLRSVPWENWNDIYKEVIDPLVQEGEHHHGRIGDPNDMPPGNGLLLWFEVDDIDASIARAEALGAEVILPRHRNPPDGDGGPNHWEIWLRDLDGYKVVLASPDGTADGDWRP